MSQRKEKYTPFLRRVGLTAYAIAFIGGISTAVICRVNGVKTDESIVSGAIFGMCVLALFAAGCLIVLIYQGAVGVVRWIEFALFSRKD